MRVPWALSHKPRRIQGSLTKVAARDAAATLRSWDALRRFARHQHGIDSVRGALKVVSGITAESGRSVLYDRQGSHAPHTATRVQPNSRLVSSMLKDRRNAGRLRLRPVQKVKETLSLCCPPTERRQPKFSPLKHRADRLLEIVMFAADSDGPTAPKRCGPHTRRTISSRSFTRPSPHRQVRPGRQNASEPQHSVRHNLRTHDERPLGVLFCAWNRHSLIEITHHVDTPHQTGRSRINPLMRAFYKKAITF